jgi:hypothetical protein
MGVSKFFQRITWAENPVAYRYPHRVDADICQPDKIITGDEAVPVFF